MMPPGARPITDPEAEVERLAAARMQPAGTVLCQEIRQADTPSGAFGIEIGVRALPGHGAAGPWPFPLRADLGQRIAAMIRADCEAAA
jgi:hypothetical protein